MSLGSTLKRIARTLPVMVAVAPGVIDAAREVKRAARKRRKRERAALGPEAPHQTSEEKGPI